MSELVLENNKELPMGWTTSDLDSLSLIITKGSTPTTYGFTYQKMGINFIKVENIVDGWIDQNTIHEFIGQDTNNFLKRSQLEENDILFSIAGTIGRTTIVRQIDLPANTNQAVAIIRCPWEFLNPKYVRLILESPILFNSFSRKSRGVGIYNLSLSDIKELVIPVPPLTEQKRIVAKIEELFSLLDSSKQILEKTKSLLKQYRQSLLHSAFEGKLTTNWRKNNHNVKPSFELIEQIQNNRIKQFELESDKKKQNKLKKNLKISILGQNPQIKSWINVKLENLVYIAGRIGWRGLKADEYTCDGPLFLSAYNLNDGGIVDFNQVNHISNDRYQESSEIQLQNNDILLIKDGAGIGRISIVKNLIQQATVNSSLLVIRSNEAFIPEFLFYFLYGPKLQNIAKQRITGSAIPHLFQRDIKKFQLSLPPLEEQHEIVKIIQNSLTNIIKMDESFSNELSNIRGLKNSILKQAFQGKLVPQDPSDEPAEILLEKIKQEKQKIISQIKRGKKNDK